MIAPGATLGVLGGGQLGRMFAQAAQRMGYRVAVYDPDQESPAGALAQEHVCADYDDQAQLDRFARMCAAITTEFENPPAQALERLAQHCPVRPNANAVAIAQDRSREKTFLLENGFPLGPFRIVRSHADLADACRAVGLPAILKTSRFGYDGKGQANVATLAETQAAFERFGAQECVLELRLPLQREISVVLARGNDGQAQCFPLAENQHRDGILDVSIVPARVPAELAHDARSIALNITKNLSYVGILAVEMFVLPGNKLAVNELAPRPHNSGHYTLDACLSSQFEQQVRALCALPLGETTLLRPAVMVNILGDVWRNGEPAWDKLLAQPQTKLHLYGKREPRAGRKMGHYTVVADTPEQALAQANSLKRMLGQAVNEEATAA